jgi:hypothetical protein
MSAGSVRGAVPRKVFTYSVGRFSARRDTAAVMSKNKATRLFFIRLYSAKV